MIVMRFAAKTSSNEGTIIFLAICIAGHFFILASLRLELISRFPFRKFVGVRDLIADFEWKIDILQRVADQAKPSSIQRDRRQVYPRLLRELRRDRDNRANLPLLRGWRKVAGASSPRFGRCRGSMS